MNGWRGFTLIELLMVVAIGGLLLAFGVPGFQQLVAGNQLSTATNTLVAALALTRSEAVKRSAQVTLCASEGRVDCSEGATFDDGWIIFVDTNADAQVSASETVIRVFPPLPASINAASIAGTITDFVSYSADGLTRLPGGGFLFGQIAVCHAQRGQCISISRNGRSAVGGGCPCPG